MHSLLNFKTHILFQKIKFKSVGSIVIIFRYFAVFLKAAYLLFKCSLVCLALKVCCAHLLTKKPSLRSMRAAEVQCL